MISGIKSWLYWHWQGSLFYFCAVLLVAMIFFSILRIAKEAPPKVEETITLAVGKLVNIRATGDFGIYNTELKFEDGSMLLVTYSFSRRHNLRVGMKYEIWKSSSDYHCKLIRGEQ